MMRASLQKDLSLLQTFHHGCETDDEIGNEMEGGSWSEGMDGFNQPTAITAPVNVGTVNLFVCRAF